MTVSIETSHEWLEADGHGAFASGTVTGIRTRRYHAMLMTAVTPPTGRFVLVNGFDAWLETETARVWLTSQRYTPDVTHPDGAGRIINFVSDPWPTWTYRLPSGEEIEFEVFVTPEHPMTLCRWRFADAQSGGRLVVRPFLSGRDLHALHRENSAFRFDAMVMGNAVQWTPYDGLPTVTSHSNGQYTHDPAWYRSFQYDEERARGLDFIEDLASPGTLSWQLDRGEAVWMLSAQHAHTTELSTANSGDPLKTFHRLRAHEESRRSQFASALHRAGDAYIVRRGSGKTIVAGYPWFADWGRDTFIALRGLGLATGRLEDTRDILLQWADAVSDGMLPNRFVEQGDEPEFNSVDAALWYVVVVGEFLDAVAASGRRLSAKHRTMLEAAVEAILAGYAAGTRHGIRMADDGLLAAGEPGVQLTWMDAKVGDWVVTPRVGKPVEVQALWINALHIGGRFDGAWTKVEERARAAFDVRFWHPEGRLYDVVDVDHHPGVNDGAVRPNQIFAVGGLPLKLLDPERARKVVMDVESKLLTPIGLRSLAAHEPGYRPRYEGGVVARDGGYHQGTVWPWLLGAFVEAWVRVHGNTETVKKEARRRFVDPLRAHLHEAGLHHVSEIADAESPHTARGCPFQAWSMGELLRLELTVLTSTGARKKPVAPESSGSRTRKLQIGEEKMSVAEVGTQVSS